MALFFIQPLALGGWLAMIPSVQDALGLNKAVLALTLMGSPLALLPVLQLAAQYVDRIGVKRIFYTVFPIQTVALILPFFAWNAVSLFFALAAVGASAAFLEVGLNLYASRFEKRTGRMIMNRSHGYWAAGVGVGSAVAVWMSPIDPRVIQMAIALTSGAAGILGTIFLKQLTAHVVTAPPPKRRLRDFPPALWFIGVGMCFGTMTEGAVNDWGAIYMTERFFDGALSGPDLAAGVAVTVFAFFLAGGRFLGDLLRRVFGSVVLARMTLGTALVGLLVVILAADPDIALLGFAALGFGVSACFPLGVSAVAAIDDRYEASNIALMSMIALCGFLLGPPLIGFIAEGFGLRVAIAMLMPGLIVAFLIAGRLNTDGRDLDHENESIPAG